MTKKYSIAEARHHFAALVHEVEADQPVEITRRGEAVAILLSIETYQRMLAPRQDFWAAYERARKPTILPRSIFNQKYSRYGRPILADRLPGFHGTVSFGYECAFRTDAAEAKS